MDFNLPDRFGLEYIGTDGARHQPVMIHRALMGSIERFIGVLIEHYAGAFPTWLSPEQVRILPVATEHQNYAESLLAKLEDEGFRVTIDIADEPLGKRVRSGKVEKIPHLLVVGDEDIKNNTVANNNRNSEQPERGLSVKDFLNRMNEEVEKKV